MKTMFKRFLIALLCLCMVLPMTPVEADDAYVPDNYTLYFENTAGWDHVYFYFWDYNNENLSGYTEWPGQLMTHVSGNVYSAVVPSDAVWVIFNNGKSSSLIYVDQTEDLIIPGTNQIYSWTTESWTSYHAHSWNAGTITTATGCTTNGVKTFTCTGCGQKKTESIAPLGHTYSDRYDAYCNRCGVKRTVITLKKVDGTWKSYADGEFSPLTTLVELNGTQYYVQNGILNTSFKGLFKYNGAWYYIKDGKIATGVTDLVKYNNAWWYVVKGKVASNTTSLVKYNGEWWYVVKGKVASNTTSLVKYNGEWWYVVKGKIAGNTTNLIKYNGEWFYVVKGKVAGKTTTLIKYNGGWYYIYNGKLAAKTTTLVKYSGKWYYVENGKVNFNKTTLTPYNGKLYYVKNGTIQSTVTTLIKHNGQWLYVKNGVFSATTGFCSYGNQKYYIKNGVAQTSLNGKVTVSGSTYYVKNGVLTNCHSAGHSYRAATCTTAKCCTKCTYLVGSPLGHSWNSKNCTRCGITKGTLVTLKVWTCSEDQYEDGWLEQMQEQFQAAHPEYIITWENGLCSEGDASSVVTRDPEAAADVYMFANDQIGTLVQAGAVSSLEGNYLNQVVTDNSQTLVNTVTYSDGKVYGFPIANNTWFMYYNKDVFSEEDVKSLDTMLTKGVVAFPWGNGWYNGAFFLANGGKVFGDRGIDASAGIQFGKDNGGYEAALKMVQLAANPNLMEDVNGLGWTFLKTGEIGAFFSGSWDYAGLYEVLGDKLGAVQLPMVEIGGVQKQMKSFAGSKVVGVNPHAQNKDAAMAFAAFLATPDAQLARYNIRGVIPASKSLINNPAIKSNPVAVAQINTITNTSVVQPFIPEMSQYWAPMGTFGFLISNGEVNSRNYKEQVDQMMAALNAPGL